jgi:hypothetical protein
MQGTPQEPTMRIKIHGGTPIAGAASLCDSCRHSRITRGHKLDEEIVVCGASATETTRVTFKVAECSDYDDYRLPSYYEMMHRAWILRPGSHKQPAGFVRASELRDGEMDRFIADIVRHEDS